MALINKLYRCLLPGSAALAGERVAHERGRQRHRLCQDQHLARPPPTFSSRVPPCLCQLTRGMHSAQEERRQLVFRSAKMADRAVRAGHGVDLDSLATTRHHRLRAGRAALLRRSARVRDEAAREPAHPRGHQVEHRRDGAHVVHRALAEDDLGGREGRRGGRRHGSRGGGDTPGVRGGCERALTRSECRCVHTSSLFVMRTSGSGYCATGRARISSSRHVSSVL